MNQTQAVLEHLQKHGTITSMEAIEKYGCTRLADKVLKLKERGYIISTIMMEGTNRYGDECRFAKYVYRGKRGEE